jgi:ATP synthase I subunit
MVSLRRLSLIQGIVTLVSAGILTVIDKNQTYPFLCGAALATLNFVLLTWLWRFILDKKPVAITLGLVVIKYAILAVVLYVFVKEWNLPLLPLFAGIATLGASFVITAVTQKINE